MRKALSKAMAAGAVEAMQSSAPVQGLMDGDLMRCSQHAPGDQRRCRRAAVRWWYYRSVGRHFYILGYCPEHRHIGDYMTKAHGVRSGLLGDALAAQIMKE